MIASLQMYASPSTTAAHDRFWAAWAAQIRSKGIDAPVELTQVDDSETIWTNPALIVSQTCGYPYARPLRGKVRLLATPHYDIEGCNGPDYTSWVVVHASNPATGIEDLRGSRAVYNGPASQSGYNSFRDTIAPFAKGRKFFSETHRSGGHRASMRMIAEGKADCATVDVVTWAIARRENPALIRELKHIASTRSVPGLPFITSLARSDDDVAVIRAAFFETLADPALADVLRTLMISGASVLEDSDYQVCLDMESAAIAAGYPLLV